MFNFRRKKKLTSKPLSEKEQFILERENREASKGSMNPFGVAGGADLSARITNTGYQTSSSTPILGESLQNEVEYEKFNE